MLKQAAEDKDREGIEQLSALLKALEKAMKEDAKKASAAPKAAAKAKGAAAVPQAAASKRKSDAVVPSAGKSKAAALAKAVAEDDGGESEFDEVELDDETARKLLVSMLEAAREEEDAEGIAQIEGLIAALDAVIAKEGGAAPTKSAGKGAKAKAAAPAASAPAAPKAAASKRKSAASAPAKAPASKKRK